MKMFLILWLMTTVIVVMCLILGMPWPVCLVLYVGFIAMDLLIAGGKL